MPALEDRLAEYARREDPGLLLDPGALSDVADLLACTDNLLDSPQVCAAVGLLHFLRAMAAPDDQLHLLAAGVFYAPLLRSHPRLVYPGARSFFGRLSRAPQAPGAAGVATDLRDVLRGRQLSPSSWAGLLWQLGMELGAGPAADGPAAEAAAVLRHAALATPDGDPRRAARLGHAGMLLLDRYRRTGRQAELGEALRCLRMALSSSAGEALNQEYIRPALASGLHDLYKLTGDLSALTEAADACRQAIAVSHPGQLQTAGQARHAVNLAGLLLELYHRDRDTALLDSATAWLHAARKVDQERESLAPDVHAALRLGLGNALLGQYQISRDSGQLREAAEQARRALLSAAPEHQPAARQLLGQVLAEQYLLSRRMDALGETNWADADAAVGELRAATAGATAGPELAASLMNLASILLLQDDDGADAEAAAAFGTAAGLSSAPPALRAEAGLAGARLAARRGDWDAALRNARIAISMLDRAVPAGQARGDREHRLKQLRDLAGDAAACALQNGDAELAAALFEQGRGVLIGHELDIRTDAQVLARRRPDLAHRFEELRGRISAYGSPAAGAGLAGERMELAGQWDALLAEIRAIAGLGRFMMPPSAGELRAAAEAGPIVLAYPSAFGSAALIVRPDGIQDVRLDLTPSDVMAAVAGLLALQDDEDLRARERRLADLLGWLWDAVAGPVMNSEAIVDWIAASPAGRRLWWCPAGLLSFLPLHAAGRDGMAVIDRVVSSYTPTVRLLEHARRAVRPAAAGPSDDGAGQSWPMLVVTSGDLPGMVKELDLLRELTAAHQIGPRSPGRAEVLAALPRSRRVHFSCHGVSYLGDPAAGYLELHDGEDGRLSVADVLALRLPEAGLELAFLSACSTEQGGPELADEAIHLGSAFQVAGYRQVIATLWPIRDRIAWQICRGFYSGLGAGPGAGGDLSGAARALHSAALGVRERFPRAPSCWAGHVHCGA